MALYCIKVHRELEEVYVFHCEWDTEPTKQQVLDSIEDEDLSYDDDYGNFEFFQVA